MNEVQKDFWHVNVDFFSADLLSYSYISIPFEATPLPCFFFFYPSRIKQRG